MAATHNTSAFKPINTTSGSVPCGFDGRFPPTSITRYLRSEFLCLLDANLLKESQGQLIELGESDFSRFKTLQKGVEALVLAVKTFKKRDSKSEE